MDHQKSIAIIISEFDRSANIWRHTFCGWNIKQNNSWFPVLKGDCSSPAYLNPTYHPSLMCISHHIPLPSPTSDETNMFGIYIYISIHIYLYIYMYPYIRPSLATYTVCRSIPSHPAWTSLKTVGSQRFFWGDFPHQPAMPRSLTSFLMQFLLGIWTYSTYIPHISTLNNWAVAKTLMSFSYNLTCLPRGLPRCFCHHSFSFRGWLVSWFCFRESQLLMKSTNWFSIAGNWLTLIVENRGWYKSNTVLKSSSAALPRSDDQRLLPQALPRASADVGFTSAGPT